MIYNVIVSNGTAHAVVINIHFKPFRGLIFHLNILRERLFFQGKAGAKWGDQIIKGEWLGAFWSHQRSPRADLPSVCPSARSSKTRRGSQQSLTSWISGFSMQTTQTNKQPAHWHALHTGLEELSSSSRCSVLWLTDAYHRGMVWETQVSGKTVHSLTQGRHPHELFRKEIYFPQRKWRHKILKRAPTSILWSGMLDNMSDIQIP